MPAYRFEALDASGKSTAGLLEADNPKAARSQLRARALVPLDVSAVAGAGTGGAPSGLKLTRRVFSSTGLAVWTRQIAGLVGAGLLVRGLPFTKGKKEAQADDDDFPKEGSIYHPRRNPRLEAMERRRET